MRTIDKPFTVALCFPSNTHGIRASVIVGGGLISAHHRQAVFTVAFGCASYTRGRRSSVIVAGDMTVLSINAAVAVPAFVPVVFRSCLA